MLLTKTEPAGIRGAVYSTVSTSGFSDLRSRCALSQKPSGGFEQSGRLYFICARSGLERPRIDARSSGKMHQIDMKNPEP